jgi:CRP-like cAMP-binding protein
VNLLARARALAASPVLADVPPPALVALAVRVRAIEVAAGQRAATRRDGSDVVLVVATGAVRAGDRALGPGSLIGAEAALTGRPPETVVADTATTLVEFAVDDFFDLLAEHAVATAALARVLVAQVRSQAP